MVGCRSICILAMGAALAGPAHSDGCSAESGAHGIPVLELYTSEGCSSCPPADRWVSPLRGQAWAPGRLIVLGFHVDYWDRLGWPDRFAQRAYTDRQHAAARRNGARFVYTPQLLLNGRDYRRRSSAALADEVSALSRRPPGARLTLAARPSGPRELEAQGTALVMFARPGAEVHAYLALYENDLRTEVSSGENSGRRLRHDFVVRELAGPFTPDDRGAIELRHAFTVKAGWNPANLHLAAFVEDARSGDILQAPGLPYCE